MEQHKNIAMPKIITYTPQYRDVFIALNRQWIETYFRIEASDTETFKHVEQIIDDGGQIFIALADDGTPVGCCALKNHLEADCHELAKMAVSPAYQGQHIGHMLGEALLAYAASHGVKRIFLEGNTRLCASIALYRSLGFTEVELSGQRYDRCDIIMEKWL